MSAEQFFHQLVKKVAGEWGAGAIEYLWVIM